MAEAVAPVDPFTALDAAQDPFAQIEKPSIAADLNKTVPSALGRGIVGAVTGIPTMGDLALQGADYVAGKTMENPEAVHSGIEKVRKLIEPVTYGPGLKRAEDWRERLAGPGKGVPLTYEPKRTVNKFVSTPLEFVPSAFTGGSGVVPKLAGSGERMVRALSGGLASEGAGQLAEQFLPEAAQPWVRGLFGIAGAAGGPAAVRKTFTPNPASVEHQAAVDVLKSAGADKSDFTAGTRTGNSGLLQTEANLSKPGSLEGLDNATLTKVIGNQSGMPGVTTFTPKALADAEQRFAAFDKTIQGARIRSSQGPGLPSNYADMQKEFADIRRQAAPSLFGKMTNIDDAVLQLRGSNKNVLSMTGDRYQTMRQMLQKSIENDQLLPKERHFLGKLRTALDDAMEREVPGLREHYRNRANFSIVKNTPLEQGQVSPEALRKSFIKQWGQDAYNAPNGGSLAPTIQAAERVFGNRPPQVGEPGQISKGAGALSGWLAAKAGNSPESTFAGYFGKDALAKPYQMVGRAIGRPLYFNPVVQSLLSNQAMLPGPTTTMNKAMALKLLSRPGAANLQARLNDGGQAPE